MDLVRIFMPHGADIDIFSHCMLLCPDDVPLYSGSYTCVWWSNYVNLSQFVWELASVLNFYTHIAKALGQSSITHRSETFKSNRCITDADGWFNMKYNSIEIQWDLLYR